MLITPGGGRALTTLREDHSSDNCRARDWTVTPLSGPQINLSIQMWWTSPF